MLESTLVWNGFTINNRAGLNLNNAPHYYIAVTSIDGLWGADIDYEEYPIAGAPGASSGDVFRRGKTLTIAGRIEAANYQALHVAKRYLQQMFAVTGPFNLIFTLVGEPQIYIKCKLSQDLSITEQQNDMRLWRSFTVALRADDPRSRLVSDNTVYPTWQT